jgi:hypothetical protein
VNNVQDHVLSVAARVCNFAVVLYTFLFYSDNEYEGMFLKEKVS